MTTLLDAAVQPAPRSYQGHVKVWDSSTSAVGAQALATEGYPTWWRIQADGCDVYCTFGSAAQIETPVIAATDSDTGKALKIPDGQHIDLVFNTPDATHIKFICSVTGGYVRAYRINR